MIASLLWGDCGDLANSGFHPQTLGVNSNPTNCRIWRGSYLCIYIYTEYIHYHMYIYICVYIYIHMYVCVCDMYIYIYMYVCINIYIYILYIYICIYIYYIPCSWDSLLTQPDPWSSFQAPAPGWRPDLPAPAPVANLQGDAAGRLEGKSATGKLATGKWSFIIIWYNRQGYTCIIY